MQASCWHGYLSSPQGEYHRPELRLMSRLPIIDDGRRTDVPDLELKFCGYLCERGFVTKKKEMEAQHETANTETKA